MPVLVHGVQSMQAMNPDKAFRTLISNETSLNALLEVKAHLADYLPEDSDRDKRSLEFLWQEVLWGIWGSMSAEKSKKLIKQAPEHLRHIYRRVLEDSYERD